MGTRGLGLCAWKVGFKVFRTVSASPIPVVGGFSCYQGWRWSPFLNPGDVRFLVLIAPFFWCGHSYVSFFLHFFDMFWYGFFLRQI